MDAYIASEEGQATLQGCGVSALVPLEVATQRLAENDININVIVPQTLFNRLLSEENAWLLVNEQGELVYFDEGGNLTSFLWDTETQKYTAVDYYSYSGLTEAWGSSSLGTWTAGSSKTVTVDGVSYTFTPADDSYTLTPAAGTYGN